MKSDLNLNCQHLESPNEAMNPSNELQFLTDSALIPTNPQKADVYYD